MDSRGRNVKPRPRPEACGHCGSTGLTPHCPRPDCPWAQCGCKHTTGYVLGKLHVTAGIAIGQPGRGT